jgi:histone arginine demethylase JMJD6
LLKITCPSLHIPPFPFQVGADDDGYAVRLPFDRFMHYATSTEHGASDDSPLYIFDGSFAERSGSRGMLGDYSVPPHFREDLFRLAGEKRRPPYRCEETRLVVVLCT